MVHPSVVCFLSLLTCACGTYDAALHLHEIKQYVDEFRGMRNLDCFDMFSGCGRFAKESRRQGLLAEEYDMKTYGPSHDITTESGFFVALQFVLRLKAHGLVVGGPPCGWWIFLSSSVHKRSLARPQGDQSNENVMIANLIVRNVVVLLCIALHRQIFLILEQPMTSLMPKYYCMRKFIEQFLVKVTTWMGLYGHRLPKPSQLFGNLSTMSILAGTWNKKSKERHAMKHPPTARMAYATTRTGWVTGGGKALSDTAAYTTKFAS